MRIKFDKIIIKDEFKNTIPNNNKFFSKYACYRKNRQLKNDIILNDKNELVDGYIWYLIAKMFDIEEVDVEYNY